jgi:hypothetical protein
MDRDLLEEMAEVFRTLRVEMLNGGNPRQLQVCNMMVILCEDELARLQEGESRFGHKALYED